MRQILIDELRPAETERIRAYLARHGRPGPIDGIYWLELPPHLLAAPQRAHADCGPFYLAVEVRRESVVFELLVRSSRTLRCSCISWADRAQQGFLLDFIDSMTAAVAPPAPHSPSPA